jgi:hypothetical protein
METIWRKNTQNDSLIHRYVIAMRPAATKMPVDLSGGDVPMRARLRFLLDD